MSFTHTHRGHCQICAFVHAIDPKTGRVAKHGYTVKFGFFKGVCSGSGHLSMHVERSYTDRAVKAAHERANAAWKLAKTHAQGTTHPERVWNGTFVNVPTSTMFSAKRSVEKQRVIVPWEEADAKHRELGCAAEIAELARSASADQEYATVIQGWADKITGKVEAYSVDALEPTAKVGETVRVGGAKKGFDAVIEAIERRPYRSAGYRRGASTVMAPHALVTRPAIPEKRLKPNKTYPEGFLVSEGRPAKQYWEPMRHLKRAVPQLVKELQEAGLI